MKVTVDNSVLCKRYAGFTVALLVCALGVALVTNACLGTSPITSLPYALSERHLPPESGDRDFSVQYLFSRGTKGPAGSLLYGGASDADPRGLPVRPVHRRLDVGHLLSGD